MLWLWFPINQWCCHRRSWLCDVEAHSRYLLQKFKRFISETMHIVPHTSLNATTPRIKVSTDLGVDKAFMLMAPHNEVEEPRKKVLAYCIFGVWFHPASHRIWVQNQNTESKHTIAMGSTYFDEAPEYWTSQKRHSLLELQAPSIGQRVGSVKPTRQ